MFTPTNWNNTIQKQFPQLKCYVFMIVYNYDADLEVSDTCVRSSLLSWVESSVTYLLHESFSQLRSVKTNMSVMCVHCVEMS